MRSPVADADRYNAHVTTDQSFGADDTRTQTPRDAAQLRVAAEVLVHIPIMVREVLDCLRPQPGDFVVDCTLGSGGHARHLLAAVAPGGHLLGLDLDDVERSRTEARMRLDGFDETVFTSQHASFASLTDVLASPRAPRANVILADLGVSAMQFDEPARGFSYKVVGPLDMRMNANAGPTAAALIAAVSEGDLATLLREHSDEPHAEIIARILKSTPSHTTHGTERHIRLALQAAMPDAGKSAIKMSIRRTFQALRIAVNDEFRALDALLASLPECLAPGGRVAVLTFHSGEDRRVKKAFQAGCRAGVYSAIAERVIRSQKAETFANRRASAAKLRWAVRANA